MRALWAQTVADCRPSGALQVGQRSVGHRWFFGAGGGRGFDFHPRRNPLRVRQGLSLVLREGIHVGQESGGCAVIARVDDDLQGSPHAPLRIWSLKESEVVAGAHQTLPHCPQMPSDEPRLAEADRHVRHVEAARELPAGEPRLGDLNLGPANRVDVSVQTLSSLWPRVVKFSPNDE